MWRPPRLLLAGGILALAAVCTSSTTIALTLARVIYHARVEPWAGTPRLNG